MIINVNIENPDSEFQPLPHYDLPNHEVALTQLFIEFSEPVHNQFLSCHQLWLTKMIPIENRNCIRFLSGKQQNMSVTRLRV